MQTVSPAAKRLTVVMHLHHAIVAIVIRRSIMVLTRIDDLDVPFYSRGDKAIPSVEEALASALTAIRQKAAKPEGSEYFQRWTREAAEAGRGHDYPLYVIGVLHGSETDLWLMEPFTPGGPGTPDDRGALHVSVSHRTATDPENEPRHRGSVDWDSLNKPLTDSATAIDWLYYERNGHFPRRARKEPEDATA